MKESRAALRERPEIDWVYAPAVFGVDSGPHRAALVSFIKTVRDRAMSDTAQKVRINFADTYHMTPAGTLLFAAELDRINHLRPGRVECNYPTNIVVAQVLQHVGIFAKLGQTRWCPIKHRTVRFWHVDSGSKVKGRQARNAMARYKYLFNDPNKKLYAALTEAMTNCKHHAYDEPRGDGYPNALPNWWMFSEFRDGRLIVTMCDLGIGIPRSLPKNKSGRWKVHQRLLQMMMRSDGDGDRIRAAIAVGASRTRAGHRGKGLMQIRSALDGLRGTMHIHSNRGTYKYEAEGKKETWTNFGPDQSILGTIILWQIPVEGS